jgi:hypothetical protein
MSNHLILAIDDAEEEVTPNIPSDGFYLDVIDPSDADLPKKLAESIEVALFPICDRGLELMENR